MREDVWFQVKVESIYGQMEFEYFDEVWILNIADLVVTDQPITNDGTKLLQIRFYPVDTTEFTPK